jgi:CheY-like chemotaxis protein
MEKPNSSRITVRCDEHLAETLAKIQKHSGVKSINQLIVDVLTDYAENYVNEHPDLFDEQGPIDKKTIKEIAYMIHNSQKESFSKKNKVLIVDDSYIEHMIYKEYLETHNCHVQVAENGKEAIEVFKDNHDFDFLVIDYKLPDITGNKLVDALSRIDNKFNVIVVTSDLRSSVKGIFNKCSLKPIGFIEKTTDNLDKLYDIIASSE